MSILKYIWKKIKALFIKRPPTIEEIILEENSILLKADNINDLKTKIQNSKDEKEKEGLIKQIAKQEVAKEILEIVAAEKNHYKNNSQNKKYFYELHELRFELRKLREQKNTLQTAKSEILPVNQTDSTSLEIGLEKMFILLRKNKNNDKIVLTDLSESGIDTNLKNIDSLLLEKSTLNRFHERESAKKKEKQIYENNIKKELHKLDLLITQNKLEEASTQSIKLSKCIKPDYKKGNELLSKSLTRLKEKELEVFKKHQAQILKEQHEEAERIKFEQERIREEQRLFREQEIIKRNYIESQKADQAKRLQALLNKKTNWRELQRILQKNNISKLFHFTDHSNLKSIREKGGLYSWHYCDKNNIEIPMPGNSTLGRNLDFRYGLQDYVRLSFTNDHPMKYVALNDGRINSPRLLHISIDVCYFENTIFSNMNATDNNHITGQSPEFLDSLKYDLFNKNYNNLTQKEKKQYQAEILVKTWIPIEYIMNLNEIGK